MNRGIYSTMNGMIAQQKLLDVTANNLANVSTNGFKRDGLSFIDTLDQTMRANGGLGPVIGSLSSGAQLDEEFTVFDVGPTESTNRPLDVAINGPKGMFAVQTPQGIRYTRDGSFTMNDQRELVTKDGYQVLDDRQQPITIPQGMPAIDSTGNVVVGATSAGQIGIFNGKFSKEGSNLYSSDNASAMADATVTPSSLEGSNVNAIDSMVQLISIGRTYDLSQKVIQQQDDLMQRLIQSLGTR